VNPGAVPKTSYQPGPDQPKGRPVSKIPLLQYAKSSYFRDEYFNFFPADFQKLTSMLFPLET
jgi:hypothetical protein